METPVSLGDALGSSSRRARALSSATRCGNLTARELYFGTRRSDASTAITRRLDKADAARFFTPFPCGTFSTKRHMHSEKTIFRCDIHQNILFPRIASSSRRGARNVPC